MDATDMSVQAAKKALRKAISEQLKQLTPETITQQCQALLEGYLSEY